MGDCPTFRVCPNIFKGDIVGIVGLNSHCIIGSNVGNDPYLTASTAVSAGFSGRVAFSSDGLQLASASADGAIIVWKADSGAKNKNCLHHIAQ